MKDLLLQIVVEKKKEEEKNDQMVPLFVSCILQYSVYLRNRMYVLHDTSTSRSGGGSCDEIAGSTNAKKMHAEKKNEGKKQRQIKSQ